MGGGGGKVKFDDTAIREGVDFAKDVFHDYALPYTEPYRTTGRNALGALSYEMGLGAEPIIYPDGSTPQIRAEAADLAAAQAQGQAPVNNEALRAILKSELSGLQTPIRANYSTGDPGEWEDARNAEEKRLARIKEINEQLNGIPADGPAYTPTFGESTENVYRGFQETPGFRFALEQGQQGVERAANAAGVGRDSGALRKAMSDYTMGMANQEYGNYLNRLSGLAGIGLSGVGTAVNAGQNAANTATSGGQSIAQGKLSAAQQNAASSGDSTGQILGLAGTVIGSFFGPAGMAIGGALGSAAGGALGGGSAYSSGMGTSSGFTPIALY